MRLKCPKYTMTFCRNISAGNSFFSTYLQALLKEPVAFASLLQLTYIWMTMAPKILVREKHRELKIHSLEEKRTNNKCQRKLKYFGISLVFTEKTVTRCLILIAAMEGSPCLLLALMWIRNLNKNGIMKFTIKILWRTSQSNPWTLSPMNPAHNVDQ